MLQQPGPFLSPASPSSLLSSAPACTAVAVDWPALFGAGLGAAELRGLQQLQAEGALGLRRLGAGEPVFGRHQRALGLMAVLSGSVGLGLARSGSPFHLQRSVPGPQWLDLASAWLAGNHSQDAVALAPALVLELPLARLRELLARQPALHERLLVGLARAVHGLTGITHDLMHRDAEHRLAAWLLAHCRHSGRECFIPLQERKRDIAAQLAITPETLSRLLRQLQGRGVLEVQGYTIRVFDLAALQALAQD